MTLKENFAVLPLASKLIIAAVALTILLFTVSYLSGLIGDFHDYRFDKKIEQYEQKDRELTAEVEAIRKENEELKKERLKLDAETEVYKQKEAEIPKSIKKEQEKLKKTVESLDREQKTTMEANSTAFERCNQLNARPEFKYKLDCSEYK